MVIFQKGVATLKAIEGDTLTLDVTVEQQAPRQAVQGLGLPAEVEVYLQRMSGSGNGTVTIDLTSLVPTSAMSARTTVDMEMSMSGNTQTLSRGTTLKMTMAPGR